MAQGRSIGRVAVAGVLLWALLGGACVAPPAVPPRADGGDAGGADAREADAGGADAGTVPDAAPGGWPLNLEPPRIVIETPREGETVAAERLLVTGTAADDVLVAAVSVRVGEAVFRPVDTGPPFDRWGAEVRLGYGPQRVTARAWDFAGEVAETTVTVERPAPFEDVTPPEVSVLAPDDGFVTPDTQVVVRGEARDDTSLRRVELRVGDGAWRLAATDDGFATWRGVAALAPGSRNLVSVRAEDSAGNATERALSGECTASPDAEAPRLTVTFPADGYVSEGERLTVTGTAEDNVGVAAVEVRVGDGPYRAAESDDGFASWRFPLVLREEQTLLEVRCVDAHGTTVTRALRVGCARCAEWTPPRTVELVYAPPDRPAVSFEMDRADLVAATTEGLRQGVVLLDIDLTALLENALDAIKGACGAGWRRAGFEAACPAAWGQAERNIWRLLTMTPANANVAGTSVEGLQELADTLAGWGLMDAFDEILAAALGIGREHEFVDTRRMAQSLARNLVCTHPSMDDSCLVHLTLEDALSDLRTLGRRFGPLGAHPGFVDQEHGTVSEILTDDFFVHIGCVSNLHWHDGLDLSAGPVGFARLADATGPTFDDVLEFDFTSPEMFWAEGLPARATVDLTFLLGEADGWMSAGRAPAPLPRGDGAVWSAPPWTVEYALAWAAWLQYAERRAGCDRCAGADEGALLWELPVIGTDEAEVVVGRAGYDARGLFGADGDPEHFPALEPNPPGWLRIWTLFGLGSPPRPQYVWDMILEIAQRRLQDGGVAEGEGDVRFTLSDIDVGLSAEEIISAMRPMMEAQKAALSRRLIGNFHETNGDADLFLARGQDGALYLFFVHPDDPRPVAGYDYAAPGFHADPGCRVKLSTTEDLGSGDARHEKVRVSAEGGETYYVTDPEGALHRLVMGPRMGDAVRLEVSRFVGAQP